MLKLINISCEIVFRWMSLDHTNDKSALVQKMVWCCETTSHYLRQCLSRFMSPYGDTRKQCVNCLIFIFQRRKEEKKWVRNILFLYSLFYFWNIATRFHRARRPHKSKYKCTYQCKKFGFMIIISLNNYFATFSTHLLKTDQDIFSIQLVLLMTDGIDAGIFWLWGSIPCLRMPWLLKSPEHQ